MRSRKDYALWGVDIHPKEIRVARVEYRGNRGTLTHVATSPLNSLAFQGSMLSDTTEITNLISAIIESMGGKANGKLAIAAPSSLSRVRRLSVPSVPPAELPLIVEGEVSHFNLHGPGGAFDFVTLDAKGSEEAAGTIGVLVAAADEPLLSGIRHIANSTGLEVERMEPEGFSLVRSLLSCAKGSATVGIAIAESTTDIIYTHGNGIRFYRTLETGARQLLSAPTYTPVDSAELVNPATAILNRTLFEELVLEIRRSVDFLVRTYPDLSALTSLLFTACDERLFDVGEAIGAQLEIPVEVALPPNVTSAAHLVESLAGPEGMRYATAIGAAMSGIPVGPCPDVDLLKHFRETNQSNVNRRNLSGSVLVGAMALVIGGVGFWLYAGQIADVRDRQAKADANITQLETDIKSLQAQSLAQVERYNQLVAEGVPLYAITDSTALSLSSGVGLNSLMVDPDRRVTFRGESSSEASLLQTVRQLQTSPLFQNVAVMNYEKIADTKSGAVRFTISAETLSLGQVSY